MTRISTMLVLALLILPRFGVASEAEPRVVDLWPAAPEDVAAPAAAVSIDPRIGREPDEDQLAAAAMPEPRWVKVEGGPEVAETPGEDQRRVEPGR